MDPLLMVQAMESRAREAIASGAVISNRPEICLPNWANTHRAIPNVFLRSGVFAVIGRSARTSLEEKVISSRSDTKLVYTGQQLDQTDLDLFAALLHLKRNLPLGQDAEISRYALLKCLEITDSGANRDSLKDRLLRISSCKFSIETPSCMYEGGLLYAEGLDTKAPIVVRLNPKIISLYSRGEYTWVHWGIRRALNGSPLAQWLHGYYATHASQIPILVKTLHAFSGSQVNSISKFRQLLEKALKKLSQVSAAHGVLFGFVIENNKVKVSTTPSVSQKNYLKKL